MNKLIDGVIETVITDEALHLAHEAAESIIDEVVNPAISKSVQAAFLRAKKASVAQNARSCRIVTEMRSKQEHPTTSLLSRRAPVTTIVHEKDSIALNPHPSTLISPAEPGRWRGQAPGILIRLQGGAAMEFFRQQQQLQDMGQYIK